MPAYRETFTGKESAFFEIRSIMPEDAVEFCKFLDLVSRETHFTNEFPEQPKEPARMAQGMKKTLEIPNLFWAGAFIGPEMVGFLAMRCMTSDGHPFFSHVYTFDLMILKKAWGKGLGNRLMEVLDEQALKRGAKRIEALVKEGNDRAQALYKKHGYEIEGTRRKAVCLGGKYIDEYYVAKLF